jgi:hypothetical protein
MINLFENWTPEQRELQQYVLGKLLLNQGTLSIVSMPGTEAKLRQRKIGLCGL